MFTFGTIQVIQLLSRCEHWFGDGTFKVHRELFFQLYTIHVIDHYKALLCVHALLPNKTEATYNKLFLQVKNHLQNNDEPQDMPFDFEIAVLNAAQN